MHIRDERPGEAPAIGALVTEALRMLPQATGTEAGIVEALRDDDGLLLSLVAAEDGIVAGHLAGSAARIGAAECWCLIGPLVVRPSRQRQGIGTALMTEALRRLRATARGAALVGNTGYYGRFGFRAYPGLTVVGCPPEVVLALPFDGHAPRGELIHHPAFGLAQSA